jgi:hypothetical protein
MLRLALVAAVAPLAFMDVALPAENPAPAAAIGVATMLQNGTILVGVRGTNTDSLLQGVLMVEPGDSTYQQLIDHVGGLKPGETKPIPPWPDPPPQNGVHSAEPGPAGDRRDEKSP